MAVEIGGIPLPEEGVRKKGTARWVRVAWASARIAGELATVAASYQGYANQFAVPEGTNYEDICDINRPELSPGQASWAKPQETQAQQQHHNTRQEAKHAPDPIVLLDPDTITPDDVVIRKNTDLATNQTPNRKLLVLPVGYTQREISKLFMEKVITALSGVPLEMRSQIAIPTASAAIDYHTAKEGEMPILDDVTQANRLVDAIAKFYKADDVAIIYKPQKPSKSGEDGSVNYYPLNFPIPGMTRMYGIMSGSDDEYLKYRLVHEIIGHQQMGFEDDYAHRRAMFWWESLVATSLVNPAIPPLYRTPLRRAKELGLAIQPVEFRCGSSQLYEIEPDNPNNIMKYAWNNNEMTRRMQRSDLLFNAVELDLMRNSKTFTTIYEPAKATRR